MPRRTLVAVAALCLVLGASLPHRLAGQEGHPAVEQEEKGALRLPKAPMGVQREWEYRQLWPCQASGNVPDNATQILAEMNAAGRRGWELVSFAPVAIQQQRDCFVATFKRELRH